MAAKLTKIAGNSFVEDGSSNDGLRDGSKKELLDLYFVVEKENTEEHSSKDSLFSGS